MKSFSLNKKSSISFLSFEKISSKIYLVTKSLGDISSPMTTTDKIGLVLTSIAFIIILSPIALSDADPYYVKGFFEKVRENIPLIENFEKNQNDDSYTIVVHLKNPLKYNYDITEQIFLGNFGSLKS